MKSVYYLRFRVAKVLNEANLANVLICEADFNVAEQYSSIVKAAPGAGAIVFFVGLVRELYSLQDEAKVSHIELQHYAGMTESLCGEIIDQAHQRFDFEAARIVHRVGKLAAGDQIVFVAVASRHRDNAFQAAQFIMDYLKTRATFWKKEVGDNGECWLGVKEVDKKACERWL